MAAHSFRAYLQTIKPYCLYSQPQSITILWLVLVLPSHGVTESTWVVVYIPK